MVLTETLHGPAGEFGPQVNVTVGALGQEVVPPGPTGVVGQLEAGTVTVPVRKASELFNGGSLLRHTGTRSLVVRAMSAMLAGTLVMSINRMGDNRINKKIAPGRINPSMSKRKFSSLEKKSFIRR